MMKRILAAIAAICMLAQPIPAAAAEVKAPSVEALGAILMDFDTGRVLWEKDARKPLAMASTTKIMTCIVALENADMADIVTVSKYAAAAPDVQMHLQPGETIPLGDLLYAMMLQSSNDAAAAVAEHVGGSAESFCRMMTEKALALGAADTVFETPNGLDAGAHHSTAYDLAVIARYALRNETFVQIIRTPAYTAVSSRASYGMTNKNRLLRELPGAQGIKTGFTGKAGHCFVGAAERDGLRLISVVLGSGWGAHGKEQKWVDTKRLLNHGFAAYEQVAALPPGADAGVLPMERARRDAVPLYYAESVTVPLTEAERESLEIRVSRPEVRRAPVEKDETVGTADIIINGEVYQTVAIRAAEGAERHDLKTSLEKVLSAFFDLGTLDEVEIVLPEF